MSVRRMSLARAGCVLMALLGVAPASGVAVAGRSGEAVSLSNERTRTWVAHIRTAVWVRAAPRYGSRKRKRLRTRTFYRSREIVTVLTKARDARGREWFRVRYPGFGTVSGWVPARGLDERYRLTTRLVIDRGRTRIRLYRSGRRVFAARIGVGAHSSPTPAGRYYVRERLIPKDKGGLYGLLAFGTSAYSPFRTDWPGGGQVGIHGTNEPELIPGHISNGCVRLRNRDIVRLGRLLRTGTPLLIK